MTEVLPPACQFIKVYIWLEYLNNLRQGSMTLTSHYDLDLAVEQLYFSLCTSAQWDENVCKNRVVAGIHLIGSLLIECMLTLTSHYELNLRQTV